jgi:hypothetical protein
MKLLLLLAVCMAAVVPSLHADRVLVLLDTLNTRDTHSIFWKSLAGWFCLIVLAPLSTRIF